MKRAALPDWPASWLRMRSPLSVKVRVSRRAIELAGGAEAINERFGARLKAFFAGRTERFEFMFSDTMTAALSSQPARVLIMLSTCVERHWAVEDKVIDYKLEGVHLDRGILPVTGQDLLSAIDPFWVLFTELRDLVVNWPEIVSAEGANDSPREFLPPIVD